MSSPIDAPAETHYYVYTGRETLKGRESFRVTKDTFEELKATGLFNETVEDGYFWESFCLELKP